MVKEIFQKVILKIQMVIATGIMVVFLQISIIRKRKGSIVLTKEPIGIYSQK